jgi:flagellar motor switch protein FliM
LGDILSQNEIDDLLKALSSGEISANDIQTTTQEKKVKTHDFRRASKFEKKDFDTANLSRKSKIEQNTPRYATILCNIKRYF